MLERFRPFYFRGCNLTAECLPATEVLAHGHQSGCNSRQPHQIFDRLSVSTRPSLQNSAYSGQHGGSLPFSGVVADKQCTCPASKRMRERYPPTPPFHLLRETRPTHREKPHKLLQVGLTPTPATNFLGRRSSCPTVNRVSQNKTGSDELEHYQHFPPFHFGLVAQSAERPVVCGRLRVQAPSSPPISRNVAQSLERPAWDREAAGENPAIPTILRCRGRIHEASVF